MEFIVEVIDSEKQKKEIIINALDRKSAISNVRSQGYLIVGMMEKPGEPEIDDSFNLKQIAKFQEIGKSTLQKESMILTCHVCNGIMAKELKKCPHCGVRRKPTENEKSTSNLVWGYGIALGVILSIFSQCSDNKGIRSNQIVEQNFTKKEIHKNPLGNDIHNVLRTKGYLAHGGDVSQSINEWKHKSLSATITGKFEGKGNGMFNRRILSLKMVLNGQVLWEAVLIRIEQGIIYINNGSDWQRANIEGE